jgi:hypothetical protein
VNGALFILKGGMEEVAGRFEVPRWVPAAGTIICLLLVGISVAAATGTLPPWQAACGWGSLRFLWACASEGGIRGSCRAGGENVLTLRGA